jgi:hypothetical protein
MLPTNPEELAGKIKRYRRGLGESQTVFGRRFKVGRLTVGSWEKGSIPNHEHMPQIMEYLSAAESKPPKEEVYQFTLPFEEPFGLAVKITPQASQTIHIEVQVRTKAS